MLSAQLHRWIRRNARNQALYNTLRRIYVYALWVTRRPHEAAYRALPGICRPEGLFLDIGANAGQTVVGIARLLPRHEIISFEPNPTLSSELEWVRSFVGDRVRIYKVALGCATTEQILYVPFRGKLTFDARASTSEREAWRQAHRIAEEIGTEVSVRPIKISVRRLDEFDLKPDCMKIDVEGCEEMVLLGAKETIRFSRPIILLERNCSYLACKEILNDFDYTFLEYDDDSQNLVTDAAQSGYYFGVPTERVAATS